MTEMTGKTGLVLEGGGMRGIYTAGVLDACMNHGVCVDGVIGVSAGAIHGCSFVSGQQGRSIRYYKRYCNDRRFMSFWNLIFTGEIAGRRFCYEEIPQKLDPYDFEAFLRSETEFYVTCSNLETGKAEYLRVRDMKWEIDLMRASASLPYVSKIVRARGMKLLDGGCTDSIPVQAFQRMGFDRNVVVLTQHDGYVKEPESMKFTKVMYRRYPAFVEALKRRHMVYNETLAYIREQEAAGKVFVIRPEKPLGIGRMENDPEELQRVYDIGFKDGEARMAEMKKFLGIL